MQDQLHFKNLIGQAEELLTAQGRRTGRLRQQLALDGEPAPILEHQPLDDTEATAPAKGRKAKA